jgi:hypothetical protein
MGKVTGRDKGKQDESLLLSPSGRTTGFELKREEVVD